jgi:TonB family protein
VNSKKDISLIRKYLNGELDARAMHDLERRAQDDPFLMDALEGYEQAGNDQQANLTELSDRLHNRADRKVKRLIPWRTMAVAASVLIFLGAGLLLFNNNNNNKSLRKDKAQTAVLVKPEVAEKSVAQAPVPPASTRAVDTLKAKQYTAAANSNKKKFYDTNRSQYSSAAAPADVTAAAPISSASNETLKSYKANKDSQPSVQEMAVADYKPKKDSANANMAAAKRVSANSTDKLLQGKAEGVTTSPSNIMGDRTILKTINGVVVGKDDGQPVVGATVKVLGRNFGAVTDVNGKFKLKDVPADQTLAVGYIGYATKHVNINNKDSLNISLDPSSSALSEVVVTKSTAVRQPNEDEAVYDSAHPRDGWNSYNEYLKKNATATDGLTGKVRVSFTVDGHGNLSNFKVVKSLSKAADQKAIDLIQYGPAWVGATDKRPHDVKVTVKFH